MIRNLYIGRVGKQQPEIMEGNGCIIMMKWERVGSIIARSWWIKLAFKPSCLYLFSPRAVTTYHMFALNMERINRTFAELVFRFLITSSLSWINGHWNSTINDSHNVKWFIYWRIDTVDLMMMGYGFGKFVGCLYNKWGKI